MSMSEIEQRVLMLESVLSRVVAVLVEDKDLAKVSLDDLKHLISQSKTAPEEKKVIIT